MTTTYTNTLSTNKDMIRFMLGDTESPWALQDEEITAMLTRYSDSLYPAAIACCRSLVAKYTRKSGNASVGPFSINYSEQAQRFSALIEELERQQMSEAPVSPYVSGYTVTDKEANALDDALEPMHARIGIHDNPTTTAYPEERYGRMR